MTQSKRETGQLQKKLHKKIPCQQKKPESYATGNSISAGTYQFETAISTLLRGFHIPCGIFMIAGEANLEEICRTKGRF